MIKRILPCVLALLLPMTLVAAPRFRPHRSASCLVTRTRPIGDTLRRVPWQLVVAGGAAASGVVFAYKVSDGIQQGAVVAAEKAPEAFIETVGGTSGAVQLVFAFCVLVAIGYLAWLLCNRRSSPPIQGHGPPSPVDITADKPSP